MQEGAVIRGAVIGGVQHKDGLPQQPNQLHAPRPCISHSTTCCATACSGHYFCEACTGTVLAGHPPSCPMCRRQVNPSQVCKAQRLG